MGNWRGRRRVVCVRVVGRRGRVHTHISNEANSCVCLLSFLFQRQSRKYYNCMCVYACDFFSLFFNGQFTDFWQKNQNRYNIYHPVRLTIFFRGLIFPPFPTTCWQIKQSVSHTTADAHFWEINQFGVPLGGAGVTQWNIFNRAFFSSFFLTFMSRVGFHYHMG